MTNSNPRLERRYRRLLAFYPRSYREQHGDDMVGVLMDGAGSDQRRPGFMETLDLLHGALTVHARYWWQMRVLRDRDSWVVRHPQLVVRVRLAVAAWLTFIAVMLCIAGYWYLAVAVVFFIGLHLLFASRAAAHEWPPSGGPATRA